MGGWGESCASDAPAGPSPPSPSRQTACPAPAFGLSELEAAALPGAVFLSLSLSLFGGACGCSACRKSLLVWGDGGWCFVEPCFPPPAFGRPACKQVEARSLNVNGSEPEVGSASAGQTSFAGWRSRGRGSNGGGTSETPGCWERQGEGGGRGPRVGSLERGEGSRLPLRGWGAAGPLPAPQPRSLLPAAPPARANCCGGALCRCAGHQRESSGFPNFAAFQPEPIPSGEPLSHLFSS